MGRKKINRVGEKKTNNFGSKIEIIEYRHANDIDIFFPEYDWTAKHAIYKQFKNGSISCPYEPRLYGFGYIGDGKYTTGISTKHNKEYIAWNGMLRRCYDPKWYEKHSTYEKCEVCEEWLNFQIFAEWYEKNYYEIPGQRMELDKDILIKNNKIYSPDTCIIAPQIINRLFVKDSSNRGEYPIGLYYDKNSKKIKVQCWVYENGKGKQEHLGLFPIEQEAEAFYIYKKTKEKSIKNLAEEYKNLIPQSLYDAMCNYEVDYDD